MSLPLASSFRLIAGLMAPELRPGRADAARRSARRTALLALGAAATAACLAGESWLMLELLAVLPDGTATPAEIERLADIGKAIAGATGATLIVRALLDRLSRAGRLGSRAAAVLALSWLLITGAIYQSLIVVTDAIVDSLPAEARQDAVRIALYRQNVQSGVIADPDYGPGGGTLSDLQRVKAINAAIGLLDRERDYAKRFEGTVRNGVEARKTEIVRQAEAEARTVKLRFDTLRRSFVELADGRLLPEGAAAWHAYETLWQTPADVRPGLLASPDAELIPGRPEVGLRPLHLGDVPPGLDRAGFGRFVAEALVARRDAAVWAIEDQALSALEAVNRQQQLLLDPVQERQLVLSVVVPPLALSFGAAGVIANATALVLLLPALMAAAFAGPRQGRALRLIRFASVIVPWLAVAGAIALAAPVPFSDEQGFARIARQTREAADLPLWSDLWLRMIGVEAQLLASLPGR